MQIEVESMRGKKGEADGVKEKEMWNTPIPFKPLKHRRISMWISLLEYIVGWYMRERMYYVNMPIPSEPL